MFDNIWKPFEKRINKLEETYQSLRELNDKLLKIWEIFEKIATSFQTISSFLPDYFLPVFLISLFFLFVLNNFLPQTPRFNFTVSVLTTSVIFLLFQVSIWQIFKVAFLLICPFYFLGFFLSFVKFYFQKTYDKSKIEQVSNMEDGILSFQNSQREFLKEFYQTPKETRMNRKLLLDKLQKVKSNVEKLEELLKK